MGLDHLVLRGNGCEDHPVRVLVGSLKGTSDRTSWCRKSFANRGLSLAVIFTFLYSSSAFVWALPQRDGWGMALIYLTTAVLIVLGKAADRLRKRHHVTSEK